MKTKWLEYKQDIFCHREILLKIVNWKKYMNVNLKNGFWWGFLITKYLFWSNTRKMFYFIYLHVFLLFWLYIYIYNENIHFGKGITSIVRICYSEFVLNVGKRLISLWPFLQFVSKTKCWCQRDIYDKTGPVPLGVFVILTFFCSGFVAGFYVELAFTSTKSVLYCPGLNIR